MDVPTGEVESIYTTSDKILKVYSISKSTAMNYAYDYLEDDIKYINITFLDVDDCALTAYNGIPAYLVKFSYFPTSLSSKLFEFTAGYYINIYSGEREASYINIENPEYFVDKDEAVETAKRAIADKYNIDAEV